MGQIEHSVAQHDHQFFMFAQERARQWLTLSLHDDAVSDPLPELRLRSPEFTTVTTDYERGFALLLFLLVFVFFDCHLVLNTLVPLRGNSNRNRTTLGSNEATHSTPKGSLICKAASGFQK